MYMIDNPALIESYAEEISARDAFSLWDEYSKALYHLDSGEPLNIYAKNWKKLSLVCSGRAKVLFITESGREVLMSRPGKGALLGDLEFAGMEPNLMTYAETDMDIISIDVNENRSKLDQDVSFLWTIINGLVAKSQRNGQLSYDQSNAVSLNARLSGYIINIVERNNGNPIIHPNWSAAAEVLHVSYRHLLRLLRELCEQGVMAKGDKMGEYRVISLPTLYEMAGISDTVS